nr:MAG TPA: hypothetical protein [Caudoviricetes sp.]
MDGNSGELLLLSVITLQLLNSLYLLQLHHGLILVLEL